MFPRKPRTERKRLWPYRARTEDIHPTLENALAELVYGARDWLNIRGFMTTDGPCVGSTAGGNSAGGSRNASWRRAVVSRTHAAMCATAVLKSGWGSGHKIMGAAELVRLLNSTFVLNPVWVSHSTLEFEIRISVLYTLQNYMYAILYGVFPVDCGLEKMTT